MKKTEEIFRSELRAVSLPRGKTFDYYRLVLRMLDSETEIGKFVQVVGNMDPSEIGPALGIYEDQAQSVYEAVQEYIDSTGRVIEDFDRNMKKLDEGLIGSLNRIV